MTTSSAARFALAFSLLSAVACSSGAGDDTTSPDAAGIQGSKDKDAGSTVADAALAIDADAATIAQCDTISNQALPVCQACILEQCVDTCATCAGDPGCVAIWTCLNTKCVNDAGVVSQSCGMECGLPFLSDPDAGNAVIDFSAFIRGVTAPGCVTTNCATQCPSQ